MVEDIEKRYKTIRWKKLRVAILKRDKYLCQESKRYGKTVPAVIVHHISLKITSLPYF